jgi:YidC/Oxa1 family membrane protein insertase
MQLMQPKNQDPQQQQANVILKVLPLMIGWFSLNVPSALCIYWVVNNIVTTASTLLIRNAMPDVAIVSGGAAATTTAPPPSSPFAPPPMRDRPAGFGFVDDGEVKPLSSIKNAEIVDVEVEVEEEAGTGMASASSNKVRARLSVFFFVLPPFFPLSLTHTFGAHDTDQTRKEKEEEELKNN